MSLNVTMSQCHNPHGYTSTQAAAAAAQNPLGVIIILVRQGGGGGDTCTPGRLCFMNLYHVTSVTRQCTVQT